MSRPKLWTQRDSNPTNHHSRSRRADSPIFLGSLSAVIPDMRDSLTLRLRVPITAAHLYDLLWLCAEGEGFEPPVSFPTLVFKTSAFVRSANLPSESAATHPKVGAYLNFSRRNGVHKPASDANRTVFGLSQRHGSVRCDCSDSDNQNRRTLSKFPTRTVSPRRNHCRY